MTLGAAITAAERAVDAGDWHTAALCADRLLGLLDTLDDVSPADLQRCVRLARAARQQPKRTRSGTQPIVRAEIPT